MAAFRTITMNGYLNYLRNKATPSGSPSRRGRDAVFVLLLAATVVIVFYPVWLGKFYAVGDMRDVFIPLESFFHQEIVKLRLPAWNPDIAWGYPVIASAQIGFFYPPSLVLRLLPLPLYLPALLVGHFLALAAGMFLLLRVLRTSAPAAFLGGVSLALGSFMVQHLAHLNIVMSAAWLPWQLAAVHRAASRERVSGRQTAILALAFGLPFLAGQMQIPLLMAAVSSVYFIYLRGRRAIPRSAGVLLAVAVVALGIAAVQLAPTLELATQSSRGPAGEFNLEQANQHSFPVYHLPTLLFPRFFGHDDTYWGKRLQIEYGIFIGTIPLMLALWYAAETTKNRLKKMYASPRQPQKRAPPAAPPGGGAAKQSRRERAESSGYRRFQTAKKQHSFWLWLLIVSFLLSLGGLSPFRLLDLEPSLWYFSAPARWLLFTVFSLSLLAAFGFDRLRTKSFAFRRFAAAVAVVVIPGVLILNILLFTGDSGQLSSLAPRITWLQRGRGPTYYTEKIDQILTSARAGSASLTARATALPVILLGALPFIAGRRRGRHVLLAAAALELALIAGSTYPAQPWSKILRPPETLASLPVDVKAGAARLLSLGPVGDTGLYLTNPASRPGPSERERINKLLLPLRHAMFSVPGVRWPASLPLAGHSTVLDKIRSEGELTNRKLAEQLNIGAALLPHEDTGTEMVILDAAPRASISGAGGARYSQRDPSQLTVSVAAETDTALIVRDAFYPGWKAYLDGRPVPVKKVVPFFRRVDIPAGHHTITMKYVPVYLYAGLAVSALTIVLCGFVIYKKDV